MGSYDFKTDESRAGKLSYLPSLDGWRALSILLVLGGHSMLAEGFPARWRPLGGWIFDAGLGVRCFFVISGFLITWLLIAEADKTGRVNLAHFYARRALRILPVYYAFLLVLAMLAHFTPYHQPWPGWLTSLTFTKNFAVGKAFDFTSGHLWSLSVEEQFYLLWPGLFIAFGTAANRWTLRILLLPLLFAPLSRVIGYKLYPPILSPIFRGFSFFSFFDSLAVGCACAILLARHHQRICEMLKNRRGLAFAIGLLLVLGPHVLSRLFATAAVSRAIFIPLGPSAQAIGMAFLILQSVVLPGWGPYPILNYAVVRWVGVLSYSIYIWQEIFCTKPAVFGLPAVWWMSFPGWLVPVFVVSTISYYGLERPLLKLRSRFRG